MKQLLGIFIQIVIAFHVSAAAETPKIWFDKTVYDFGRTSEQEIVAGTFHVRNVGGGTLKLNKPVVSCGCTVAELKPDSLAPGEEGSLSFTLELGRSRADLIKHITITSNDPASPLIELTIKAQHVPVYEVTPTILRVDVGQDETTNAMVRIRRTDGKELKIDRVETSKPWIRARVERVDDQSAQISLRVSPDGTPRQFADSIQVFAENRESPVSSVFITGRVFGDAVISPEMLVWSVNDKDAINASSAAELTTRRLVVRSRVAGRPIELRNVVSSVPEVKLELLSTDGGYDILAKLDAVPKKTVNGAITAESNLATLPKLQVPIHIRVLQNTASGQ